MCTGVEADRDSCLELLHIVDCWRKHPDPPFCNSSLTPLVECAEQGRQILEDCDDGNYTLAADIAVRAYKARDDTICNSSKLRHLFRNSFVCWNQAKTCTQHLTFALPRDLPFDCPKVYAEYYECKRKSPETCYYYMERLFKSMYRASPCCGTVLVYHRTFVLLALLTTFLRYLYNG